MNSEVVFELEVPWYFQDKLMSVSASVRGWFIMQYLNELHPNAEAVHYGTLFKKVVRR